MCPYCEPLIKAIDRYIEKADGDLEDTLEDAGFEKPQKTVEAVNDFEESITNILEDATAYILSRAREAIDLEQFRDMIWPDIELNDEVEIRLARMFKDKFSRLVPDLTEAYLQKTDHGLYVTRVSERTITWIEEWSGEIAKDMHLTTNKQIEKILTDGIREGVGIDEITRRIQESGLESDRLRARRTALTEVLRAHSVAAQEAYEQSPAVDRKMWRHSGTYRIKPRQNHMDMDGSIVPVSEPFTLYGADGGTYYPMYPRDTSLPVDESQNCHCVLEPVVSDEVLGMTIEERRQLQQEAIDAMDDNWEEEINARIRAERGIT